MRRGGLGVVTNPDGSFYVPGWCSWMPFSSFNDSCKLPTPAQVQADQLSNLGPAADPARVEALKRQWAETDAYLWRQNPEQYAEYQFAMDYPTASAAIGTGTVARTVTKTAAAVSEAFNTAGNWPVYLLIGSAALAVLAVGVSRR